MDDLSKIAFGIALVAGWLIAGLWFVCWALSEIYLASGLGERI